MDVLPVGLLNAFVVDNFFGAQCCDFDELEILCKT